jgi:hypothetical protein
MRLVLPNQLASELTDLSAGDKITWDDCKPFNLVECVENRMTGTRKRWSLVYELVLRTADGALWRRLYEVGATESQYQKPFEYDGPEVPFDRVRMEPDLRVKYVPIGQ